MKQLSLGLIVVVAACSSYEPPVWTSAGDLSTFCARSTAGGLNGRWELARINGVEWTGSTVTLSASATAFGGQMACNSYGVGGAAGEGPYYEIIDARLLLGDGVLQTVARCTDRSRGDFDRTFIAILQDRPYVVRDEDQLCLRTDDNSSLEFWRADEPAAAITSSPLPGGGLK